MGNQITMTLLEKKEWHLMGMTILLNTLSHKNILYTEINKNVHSPIPEDEIHTSKFYISATKSY